MALSLFIYQTKYRELMFDSNYKHILNITQ
jgi:hypothetical protein